VVFVTPQGPPGETGAPFAGGVERLVAALAGGLAGADARPAVLTTRYLSTVAEDGRLVPGLRQLAGGRYELYAMPPGGALVDAVARVAGPGGARVIFVVDNGGPFSRPTPQELLDAAAAVRSRWPLMLLVSFPGEEIRFYSRTPAIEAAFVGVLRELAGAVDRAAFVSRTTLESFAGLGRDDACVVGPGVRTALRRTRTPEPGTIACISRFGAWAVHKNHVPLLEALRLLGDGPAPVRCHFVGAETPALVPMARALGVEDAVVVHGLVSERSRRAILARASLHVLPSAIEAFGFATAEALAAGVPVVACSGTAVEEMRGEGVHLCAPRRPSRFAAAWGMNTEMAVEPDPAELAACIRAALDRGTPPALARPRSLRDAGVELYRLLESMRGPSRPRARRPAAAEPATSG
jgi:glycosyltransferase involved in cell wall biosynthesis